MRFFASGKVYDFMGLRRWFFALSFGLIGFSLLLLLGKIPGVEPKFGTDFKGGTEVEVAFKGPVTTGDVRKAVEDAGFHSPDVVRVESTRQENHYLIRVQEVSTLTEEQVAAIERALCFTPNLPESECPAGSHATEVRVSPGGDKVTARFHDAPDLERIRERMSAVKGIQLRPGENNPFLQSARDHKVEIQLVSRGEQRGAAVKGIQLRPGENNPFLQSARDHKVEIQLMSRGDQLVAGLKTALGPKAPDRALRSEWIGPRAGAQLRDSAVKSIAIALVFIMAYVAFRFDLR